MCIRKEKESGINQKIQIASTQPTLVRDVAKQVENTAQQDLPKKDKSRIIAKVATNVPMQYVYNAIIALYIIITMGVMVRVLMDHRQPAKTMAWLLVLTFVPVVGIVFYFFFGQNTRKDGQAHQTQHAGIC